MDSSISAEWSVTSLFLFFSQSSREIAIIVTVAMKIINIATVAEIIDTFLFVLSAVSSSVSPHAFSVSKGTPLLQEAEVLVFMVADGATEGALGVDNTTTGRDEEDEGDSRDTGVVIVADGATEGVVGVDEATAGLDEEDEEDIRVVMVADGIDVNINTCGH